MMRKALLVKEGYKDIEDDVKRHNAHKDTKDDAKTHTIGNDTDLEDYVNKHTLA